ncbi:hypothetical protein [Leptospira noguchii]|nr:hypothetical protein [Leptospira noguchii]
MSCHSKLGKTKAERSLWIALNSVSHFPWVVRQVKLLVFYKN